ncbi:MAG: methyltransferase domain-containing protein [Syntrophaceae bacterium]|nr:methyltransferase domain-containing protein [Syntrophaceae bacterium]
MKKTWLSIALIAVAAVSLLVLLPRERADLATPEDTGILWDGLYLGKYMFAEVPYVATPYEVVDEMIRLADVRADDVVYDLGCGDGRLVIEAVRRTGCRGVGVDIDGDLIALCRARARAAGVEERTRFETQDFFETDVREATVMLIYLFTHINLRLRPKFLEEMKPGSRVVSNTFDMGDWKPDRTVRVGGRRIFCWVVPANVTGTWTWTEPGRGGGTAALAVDQRFQQIRGTLRRGGTTTAIVDASVTGDRIAFAVEQEADGVRVRRDFTGIVEGDRIAGTVVSTEGTTVRTSRWRAVRDPSTRRPIDAGSQKTEFGP